MTDVNRIKQLAGVQLNEGPLSKLKELFSSSPAVKPDNKVFNHHLELFCDMFGTKDRVLVGHMLVQFFNDLYSGKLESTLPINRVNVK